MALMQPTDSGEPQPPPRSLTPPLPGPVREEPTNSTEEAQQPPADAIEGQDTSIASLMRMALGMHETPLRITPTHRFLFLQGVLYAGAGLLFMILPRQSVYLVTLGALSTDSFEIDDSGHPTELRMLQFTGFLVMLVGYFYMQGARENTLHFVAASTLNRVVFVPLLMLLLAIFGARLPLCILFALLDPALTALTLLSLRGKCPLCRKDAAPDGGVAETETEADPRFGLVALLKRADPSNLFHSGEMVAISPTHRLIVLQGLLYTVVGLAAMIVPTAAISVFTLGSLRASMIGDKELIMMQMTGAAVVFIGHFFIQGARGNTLHFVAAITFNRLLINPPALLLLYLLGVHWQICLFEGLLDPALTLLTLASLQGKLPCLSWLNRDELARQQLFTDCPAYHAAAAAAANGGEQREPDEVRPWTFYCFEMFVRRNGEAFRDDSATTGPSSVYRSGASVGTDVGDARP